MTKKAMIRYTSRDFNSIKQELVNHAKRYYPERYNDFNNSSFGSLMFDAVAYVGDVLSFYLDYQVNESYIDNAVEYSTIQRLARQVGYKTYGSPCSFGMVTAYCIVPANSTGLGPDTRYIPIIKSRSTLSSANGNQFVLLEDIDFRKSNVEFIAATYNDATGKPLSYALRSYGRIKSGREFTRFFTIGTTDKFHRIRIGPPVINEIVSVSDSAGNKYYQVDYLTQDTVYIETTNQNYINDGVPSIIKPIVAARRFVMEQDDTGTYLRFGYGSEDETASTVDVSDPKSIVMKFSGKDYFTDTAFDPHKFLNTDKFGIRPSNTQLKVVYSSNVTSDANEAVGSINSFGDLNLEFTNNEQIPADVLTSIRSNMQVANEEAFVVTTVNESPDELRYRATSYYSAQQRVVTKTDYESYCYQMPPTFGSVKRAVIVNDPSYTNRRMALYVISENSSGDLTSTNSTIKSNLKTWLQKNKMIGDAIDILDAKIVNIAFDYQIVVDTTYDKIEVIQNVQTKLQEHFADKLYIGEPIYITQIYNMINKVVGVIDTVKVTPKVKSGGAYSDVVLDIIDLKSQDGTYLKAPRNVVFEIKYPTTDIVGVVI